MTVLWWIAGIMFTLGYVDDDVTSVKNQILDGLLVLFAWPLVLGIAVRRDIEHYEMIEGECYGV